MYTKNRSTQKDVLPFTQNRVLHQNLFYILHTVDFTQISILHITHKHIYTQLWFYTINWFYTIFIYSIPAAVRSARAARFLNLARCRTRPPAPAALTVSSSCPIQCRLIGSIIIEGLDYIIVRCA